jgi:hypothetical protein
MTIIVKKRQQLSSTTIVHECSDLHDMWSSLAAAVMPWFKAKSPCFQHDLARWGLRHVK